MLLDYTCLAVFSAFGSFKSELMSEMMQPVDVVIAWVDGNDPS
jgi:hypothetical protein